MIIGITLWLALLAPQAATAAPQSIQLVPPTPTSAPNAAAPTAPAWNGAPIRRIGGGVTPPSVTYTVAPEFTKEARKRKLSGMTLVNLIVDAEGNPQNVHVARSMADTVDQKHQNAALELDEKAMEAVKQYKFIPAKLNGKSVAVELNVEVNFKIF